MSYLPRSIEALRHDSRSTPLPDVALEDEAERQTRVDRAIVCAACAHRITSERQRVAVNGAHEHHCVNPAGYQFHIGCFRDAPGCTVWGAPTTEFTWFAGYAWCYALCGDCRAHLGWRFESDASGFFGLILARLIGAA
jgi:hypothetical protein